MPPRKRRKVLGPFLQEAAKDAKRILKDTNRKHLKQPTTKNEQEKVLVKEVVMHMPTVLLSIVYEYCQRSPEEVHKMLSRLTQPIVDTLRLRYSSTNTIVERRMHVTFHPELDDERLDPLRPSRLRTVWRPIEEHHWPVVEQVCFHEAMHVLERAFTVEFADETLPEAARGSIVCPAMKQTIVSPYYHRFFVSTDTFQWGWYYTAQRYVRDQFHGLFVDAVHTLLDKHGVTFCALDPEFLAEE
jgi:hypothetical protein